VNGEVGKLVSTRYKWYQGSLGENKVAFEQVERRKDQGARLSHTSPGNPIQTVGVEPIPTCCETLDATSLFPTCLAGSRAIGIIATPTEVSERCS
jgi:hypothetical protein